MPMVLNRIQEHYDYASKFYDKDCIIGIFLTGSQNYGTSIPESDIDTKLLVTPSLSQIYSGKDPESSTKHFPDSNELITVKDIRQFLKEVKKQNINVLELLYTDYFILNPYYQKIWEQLVSHREEISRYNPILAIKAIKGNAHNAYSRSFSDECTINRKMVANLVRYEYYINKYIEGLPYEQCLIPDEETRKYILQIRSEDMGQTALRLIADNADFNIKQRVDEYCKQNTDFHPDEKTEELINEFRKDFIDTSILMEYAKRELI